MSEQDKQCREALLPCPFCDGKAYTGTSFVHGEFDHNAHCGDCLAYIGEFDSEASAIKAWNTRTQPKLVLALPDFETRRITVLSEEMIPETEQWEAHRLVTCAIED